MKKNLAIFCLLVVSSLSASGAYWYVKSGGGGAKNGSDWNNAWADFKALDWSKLKGGDTVYIAGGSYSELRPAGSGASGNPITFSRVRVGDPGANAAGWSNSFDSTVTIQAPSGGAALYIAGALHDLAFDGRMEGGMVCSYGNGGQGKGCEIDQAASSYITFKYITARGPGYITQSGACRGFDLTPSSGGPMRGVVMSHCETSQPGDSSVYVVSPGGAVDFTMEYCKIHDARAVNAATWHPNEIYCGTITGGVFRYNSVYNIGVEGLFFNDPGNSDIQIYGNLFYWGTSKDTGARGLEFNKSGNSKILVYGNAWIDLPLGLQCGKTDATFSGCEFKNNIVWNCTTNFKGGWTAAYNAYSNSTSEPNTINGIADPFVSKSSYDYHLRSGAAPIGKGTNLGPPYNVDRDGLQQPAAWSMGAYVYGGTPGPSPTPTPNPTATPAPTPAPTATPTPSPNPTPGFAIGESVTPTGTLNVRSSPAGALIGIHAPGEVGLITAGPDYQPLNGEMVTWWQIDWEANPKSGWSGEDLLEAASGPTPAPTPSPTPGPNPGPSVKITVTILAPPGSEVDIQQSTAPARQ